MRYYQSERMILMCNHLCVVLPCCPVSVLTQEFCSYQREKCKSKKIGESFVRAVWKNKSVYMSGSYMRRSVSVVIHSLSSLHRMVDFKIKSHHQHLHRGCSFPVLPF